MNVQCKKMYRHENISADKIPAFYTCKITKHLFVFYDSETEIVVLIITIVSDTISIMTEQQIYIQHYFHYFPLYLCKRHFPVNQARDSL